MSGLESDQVEVGTRMSELRVEEVTLEKVVRYVGASGDFNPLHHDPAYARRAGHDDVVVPGMYVAGLASTAVVDWAGFDALLRFRTRFVDTVYAGDALSVGGEVTAVEGGPSVATAEVKLTVRNGDGDAVVTGEATIRL